MCWFVETNVLVVDLTYYCNVLAIYGMCSFLFSVRVFLLNSICWFLPPCPGAPWLSHPPSDEQVGSHSGFYSPAHGLFEL